LGADVNPGRRRALNAAGNVLMAAPFVVMGYGAMVERLDFQVRELDVPLPGLPLDLDGLRILQLSDIHLSAFLTSPIWQGSSTWPSICTRTSPWSPGTSSRLAATLGCLHNASSPGVKSDAGTFGCMGNHEHYAGVERYTAEAGGGAPEFVFCAVKRKHCASETQSSTWLAWTINPWPTEATICAEPGAWSSPAPRTCCSRTIPTCFPWRPRQGYNLLLAGHTHGGQVTVEILDQSINPRASLLLMFTGSSAPAVRRRTSRAASGTIGIPARIGAPPEICVLRLRKA